MTRRQKKYYSIHNLNTIRYRNLRPMCCPAVIFDLDIWNQDVTQAASIYISRAREGGQRGRKREGEREREIKGIRNRTVSPLSKMRRRLHGMSSWHALHGTNCFRAPSCLLVYIYVYIARSLFKPIKETLVIMSPAIHGSKNSTVCSRKN